MPKISRNLEQKRKRKETTKKEGGESSTKGRKKGSCLRRQPGRMLAYVDEYGKYLVNSPR